MLRLNLILGILTMLLLYLAITYHRKAEFNFENVAAIAASESRLPYEEPPQDLPKFLKALNYDQNRDIRWKDDFTLWRHENLPFQVKFFHRTGIQPQKVDIFSIHGTTVRRVIYSPHQFDYGKNRFTEPIPEQLGFSGFRVHYPINKREYLDEIIVFLGGCYFRTLGKNQQYGLSARALAVNSGLKEEFPRFTKFWLREPKLGARTLQIYGLLEGPSVVGAYDFLVTPGESTRVDVHGRVYVRKKIERIGIAPLSSMYWFGENYRSNIRDFRPEVHDSDGLLIHNHRNEWLWRPLSNGGVIQDNSFVDDSPHGFGLLQRDRDFRNYQDLESNYQNRPSVWMAMTGDWGRGSVRLIQFPTENETNDNIVTFWTPEAPVEAGTVLDHHYTMYWYTTDNLRPPFATATETRIHYPVGKEPTLFVIDFAGGGLDRIAADTPPRIDVETNPPGLAQNVMAMKNDYTKGWRATFEIPSTQGDKEIELRVRLFEGERLLSETWTYTWKASH